MKNDPLVEILKEEFQRKKARNRSYSLRSYARDLELDPSNLSKMMNDQITIGPSLREKLGRKLGFEKADVQSWLSPATQPNTVDGNYRSHGMDVFQVIAEWQHYALLEYFKLVNGSSDLTTIAAHLGLKRSVVDDSLKRLIAVGLLTKTESGFAAVEESSSSILNVATSKAHREQQIQIIDGAADALRNVPIELRSQSSMTMAIDAEKLDEAKAVIKKFRRDMGRILSSSKNLNSVYQLSISLYPVTKIEKLNKEN